MFTGIVETVGRVRSTAGSGGGRRILIEGGVGTEGLRVGDSVAVNGTCLTVVESTASGFAADVVLETLQRTNLGKLQAGDFVNLERPMRADGRFDGHIVQGHIDGVGVITAIAPEGHGKRAHVEVDPRFGRYLVEKGSVTVDGVSLTVAGVTATGFEVALIPHTLAATTFGLRGVGDQVNLEFDVLAKYLERLIEKQT
ncbi:MAG TPA: riboflavin synthase [Acidimicrobiia bacterium]|nr:riboflavin synthase [Acidimicrobiia bacterium]